MHRFESKFSHFLDEQSKCVHLEACATCGELDDLAYAENLEEDARRSYTLLARIEEYRSDTKRLYLDGPPLALLKEHTKKLQVSKTHPLLDSVGFITLPTKPLIECDVYGRYFVRLNSEYIYSGNQSHDVLTSVDLTGKRLDTDTSEIKWRLNDQIRCMKQFCERESVPALLLVDETRTPEEFKALNRDETYPDETRNEIINSFTADHRLNITQTEALDHAMCHHVTCIQGPPGTGKTRVAAAIASAAHQLQKLPSQRQCVTFITAPTNQAVDNFEEKISESLPGQVYRWGDVEKQKARAKENGLDIKVDHWIRDKSSRLQISCQAVIEKAQGSFVSGTCNSFSAKTLDRVNIFAARIIVDERGQAASWESLGPCAKCEKQAAVTFIGDHNQLPPCLKSFEAQRRGGHVSILEYCFRNPAHKRIVLEAQFRMHPDLLSYVNTISYNHRLYSTMLPRQQDMPRTFPTGTQERLVFINGLGSESRKSHSYYNDDEAKNVIICVRQLLSSGEVRGQDITVLAAYKAQAEILRVGIKNLQISESVQVYTLDGFQGRENKIIILSTVRNNALGSIGFLSSPQRITVAFSRAKAAMLVFGNAEALLSDDREGVWMIFFKNFKAYDANYHAMEIACNPKVRQLKRPGRHDEEKRSIKKAREVRQQKRSGPHVEEKESTKKARVDNFQLPDAEVAVKKVPPELDRHRLLEEVKKTLHWIHDFLNLAQVLTGLHGFSDALDMVTCLKKIGDPVAWKSQGTSGDQYVNDTRKKWSHSGGAVYWGASKLKDPTNLVYYSAFQVMLTRENWTIPKLNELRKRFVEDELPPAQLRKVCAAQSMNRGVLVDAGDYLECLLAICDAEDPDMGTNHSAEFRHPARLTTNQWLNIRYHLNQLISVAATVVPLCFHLSQSTNYAFQSEFTLNVIRDLVRLEQNVFVYPELFVQIQEEIHHRMRSSS